MRAARETPSTCAALSQGARPLASRIFQFNIQRLFSSASTFLITASIDTGKLGSTIS